MTAAQIEARPTPGFTAERAQAPSSARPGPARSDLEAARRWGIGVDLAAVSASMAANIAAAPPTVAGWLVAIIAPIGLFGAIGLWHRSRGIVDGPAGWAFSAVFAGVAIGAAVVSFDHIRHVAIVYGGQDEAAAIILPLVVDLLAVLATIVVVTAGRRLEQIDTEERAAEQAQRAAEAEEARQAAQARRDAQEAAQAAEEARQRAEKTRAASNGARVTNGDREAVIAATLAANPATTKAELAELLGVTEKTIQRSQAWKTRPQEAAA